MAFNKIVREARMEIGGKNYANLDTNELLRELVNLVADMIHAQIVGATNTNARLEVIETQVGTIRSCIQVIQNNRQ